MKVNKICLAVLCGLLLVGCGGQSDASKEETKTSEKEESTDKTATNYTYYKTGDGKILVLELDSRRADIDDPDEPMGVQPIVGTEDQIRFNPDKVKEYSDKYLPELNMHGGSSYMTGETNLIHMFADEGEITAYVKASSPRYQIDIDELIDPDSRYGDEINSDSQVYQDSVKPIFNILQAITNDPNFVDSAEKGWLNSSQGLMTTYRQEDGLYIKVKSEFDKEDKFAGITITLGYDADQASNSKYWSNTI